MESLKLVTDSLKRVKPSLFNIGVTTSHIQALNPLENLDDYSDRDSFFNDFPFAKILLEGGFPVSSLKSLLRCGIFTGSYFKSTCGCGSKVFPIRHKCSSRSCPFCSKRRKRRLIRKYKPLLSNLPTTPLYSLKLLTISPQNYNSYLEGSEHIRKCLSKMFRRKYFKDKIEGGVYVIEAKTKNSEGLRKGWNCHVHLIVYSRFLNNRLYGFCSSCSRRMWIKQEDNKTFYCSNRQCNSLVEWDKKDSILTTEIKKVFNCAITSDVQKVSSSVGALDYCLKYISSNKDDFYNDEDFAQYMIDSRARRLVSVFGVFYSARFSPLPYCCNICDEKIYTEILLFNPVFTSVPPPS